MDASGLAPLFADALGGAVSVIVGDCTLYPRVCSDAAVPAHLFATSVWNGATVWSDWAQRHKEELSGLRILEVGAGAGLPSLVSAAMGASFVCATDFPDEHLLSQLRANFVESSLGEDGKNWAVEGLAWGEPAPAGVLARAPYDVIVCAECLWMPEAHGALLRTLKELIAPDGRVFCAWAHHTRSPRGRGREAAFFHLAAEPQFGFATKRLHVERREANPGSGCYSGDGELVSVFIDELKLRASDVQEQEHTQH